MLYPVAKFQEDQEGSFLIVEGTNVALNLGSVLPNVIVPKLKDARVHDDWLQLFLCIIGEIIMVLLLIQFVDLFQNV